MAHRPKQDTYSLIELQELLGIPVNALRMAVINETLTCSMRHPIFRHDSVPAINHDAAVKFCINLGINPAKLIH